MRLQKHLFRLVKMPHITERKLRKKKPAISGEVAVGIRAARLASARDADATRERFAAEDAEEVLVLQPELLAQLRVLLLRGGRPGESLAYVREHEVDAWS